MKIRKPKRGGRFVAWARGAFVRQPQVPKAANTEMPVETDEPMRGLRPREFRPQDKDKAREIVT